MRKAILPSLIIFATLVVLARLFYLQIIDDEYKLKSENNAIKIVYEYPERGYIYDRKGKLMVANQPSYDIMVVPREIKNLDTLKFCDLLSITREEFDKKIKKATVYSHRLPSVFLPQLNKKEYAEKIKDNKNQHFLFKRLDSYSKQYDDMIWDSIYPPYSKPFNNYNN